MNFIVPGQCHSMHEVQPNGRSSSTLSATKSGTLREGPLPQKTPPARRAATIGLKARDPRKPLTVSIRFVGNGDCEWVIEARGRRYKAAGCENVHEVLARLSRARS
jgi:hypothetical protein